MLKEKFLGDLATGNESLLKTRNQTKKQQVGVRQLSKSW